MIPILARTRAGLAASRATLRHPVTLVPTMGALHDGHRALLRRAREISGLNGSLVVSIFVNPLQFGAGEDLDRYPRALERDIAICAEEAADVVFAPGYEQIYPAEQLVTISPGPLGNILEGEFRPGYFEGMLTVVLKLFNLVMPDVAVFGQKDAQQLAAVRAMVVDLNLPVGIASVATVREPDGLAMSSRNARLSAAERVTAVSLSRALRAGSDAARAGPCQAIAVARAELTAAAQADPPLVTDYLSLVDPQTFAEVGADHAGPALLLVAASVGKTRLIDNVPLTFEPAS
jgi:pantoate--beta-alanine ligase